MFARLVLAAALIGASTASALASDAAPRRHEAALIGLADASPSSTAIPAANSAAAVHGGWRPYSLTACALALGVLAGTLTSGLAAIPLAVGVLASTSFHAGLFACF
jgi:hypothetical protein